jgi:hypothetical protein
MENLRFGIVYTLLMVVLHFVLSGGYTTVSRGRKRADSGYWEDNEVRGDAYSPQSFQVMIADM